MIASLACRSYTASALSSPTRTLAGSRGADRGGTAAYPAAPAPEHSRGLRTAGHRRRRCRRLRPWRYRKPAAQPGSRAPLHIAAATHLMHNGPLTVIKQSRGHGGVYPVGRTGLGSMLLRCRGAFSACMELEYIAWSPDGARIALGVTSYATPSRYDGLHVVDLASGRDTQLTTASWNDPAWSPDGRWIAYVGNTRGAVELASADGSQHRRLQTGYPGEVRYPTWSPDGTRIAFEATPRSGCGRSALQVRTCAVYAVDLDGTHLRLLARHAASPAWSPRGTNHDRLPGQLRHPVGYTERYGCHAGPGWWRVSSHRRPGPACLVTGRAEDRSHPDGRGADPGRVPHERGRLRPASADPRRGPLRLGFQSPGLATAHIGRRLLV